MERISELITANCKNKIFESQKFLKKSNINFSCEALDIDNCESNHKRWITNAVDVFTWFVYIMMQIRAYQARNYFYRIGQFLSWVYVNLTFMLKVSELCQSRVSPLQKFPVWHRLASVQVSQSTGAGSTSGLCDHCLLWSQECGAQFGHNIQTS